ncbi:MAG: hypothetical protein ABI723_26775 [Bacteroidia bacterium]
MGEEQFIAFRKFNDEASSKEFADLLNKNNIDFLIEDNSSRDVVFSSVSPLKEYIFKLNSDDFQKANVLLSDISEDELNKIPADYYLFEFTDEELYEILAKQDEWGPLDYALAQKLLKQRGKEVTPQLIERFKNNRIKDLARPENDQTFLIALGYFFVIAGGVVAIFIGWHLLNSKKILPNGETVYSFNAADRKNGFRIFILGIIFVTIFSIWKLIDSSNKA